MLHSLGLGENPPSSNDITAKVLDRCGAAEIGAAPDALVELRFAAPGPGLLGYRPYRP